MEKKSAMYIFKSCVHLFDTQLDVENAGELLRRSDFNVKKLSLIAKGYHGKEQPADFYTVGNRIKIWDGVGENWNGIWGDLLVPEMIFLPEVGLVAMAGPLAFALITALEGNEECIEGRQERCAFSSTLEELGISHELANKYEVALKSNCYVLMVHGDQTEVEKVNQLLSTSKST